MLHRLSILCFLLVLAFASCEDKESSKEKNTASPATNEAENRAEENQTASKETDIENDNIKEDNDIDKGAEINFPIPQEKLIPTLEEFGEHNPENRIRITTEFGEIEVSLYRDTPLHRANFIMLVKEDYFEETYFHRVAKDFVIQGGNSDNLSTNEKRRRIGSYLIPSEFEAGHQHTRGAFSAAKYSEQNVSKASSPYEFFIVTKSDGAHHLDNDHTVFGRVTKGMDVVDKIQEVEIGDGEWPVNNIPMDVEIIE